MTNFEILLGTSLSYMSNFRRVKNSHLFVAPVKNSFDFFINVTNTCEFFTLVTDSFEFKSQSVQWFHRRCDNKVTNGTFH